MNQLYDMWSLLLESLCALQVTGSYLVMQSQSNSLIGKWPFYENCTRNIFLLFLFSVFFLFIPFPFSNHETQPIQWVFRWLYVIEVSKYFDWNHDCEMWTLPIFCKQEKLVERQTKGLVWEKTAPSLWEILRNEIRASAFKTYSIQLDELHQNEQVKNNRNCLLKFVFARHNEKNENKSKIKWNKWKEKIRKNIETNKREEMIFIVLFQIDWKCFSVMCNVYFRLLFRYQSQSDEEGVKKIKI